MRILFDDRPGLTCPTGVGRYARTLAGLLPELTGHEPLSLSTLAADLASAEEAELELPALITREGVDVFHTPLWHLPAVLPCRAVVTVHDAIPATHPHLTSEAFRPLWRRAFDEVPRADAVVCPSEHARTQVFDALDLDPGRVHVVPEAPAPVFGPRPADEVSRVLSRLEVNEPYVLVVGSIEPRKNPDGLLDALVTLPAPERPLVLFAGPTTRAFDLPAEAARRGVAGRARALGLVDDAALAALYTGALAIVCCSLVEGFGLPVVEAWACGAPVIASRTTALGEVAGDAAFLVDPTDPDQLGRAIAEVAGVDALRQVLRAKGQARLAERFSRRAVCEALSRVYEALTEVHA